MQACGIRWSDDLAALVNVLQGYCVEGFSPNREDLMEHPGVMAAMVRIDDYKKLCGGTKVLSSLLASFAAIQGDGTWPFVRAASLTSASKARALLHAGHALCEDPFDSQRRWSHEGGNSAEGRSGRWCGRSW